MDKIRILLADDHTLIRSGIATLLQSIKDFSVVGEAEDGEDAVHKTGELRPDVIVIDLSMPKLSGIEATKIIKKRYPETNVLVLTMHENEEYVYQILKSGASGYVLKSAGRDELAAAIRAAAKGEKYFSPKISQLMAEGYVKRVEKGPSDSQKGDVLLTRREREILALVADGMTSRLQNSFSSAPGPWTLTGRTSCRSLISTTWQILSTTPSNTASSREGKG
jgi:two-component system response regulator NreC